MKTPASGGAAEPLDALATALEEERCALLDYDPVRLERSIRTKRDALEALETHPPQAADARLARLREANTVNGLLLAQRRRNVQRHLRRLNPDAPGYDAHGLACSWQNRHSLAVA